MKKAYESNRYIEDKWLLNQNDQGIPVYFVKPKNNIEPETLLLFVPGLNGNGSMIKYFNYDFFDNILLFSYDQRAQGFNLNKPSRNYKKYLNDLNILIDEILKRHKNIKNIFICGESWGSTLSFLYHKYYDHKIKGVIGWNMPYHVVDLSPLKGFAKFKNSMKVFWTFLTSIDTYGETLLANELTNNKILLRLIHSIKRQRLSNKVVLAVWRSLKKSWKYLKNDFNYLYIQSLEDAMISLDKVKKEAKINQKIIIFEKGYHLLTFDDNVSDKLFKKINDFINESLTL